jgi:hypothetical protein
MARLSDNWLPFRDVRFVRHRFGTAILCQVISTVSVFALQTTSALPVNRALFINSMIVAVF